MAAASVASRSALEELVADPTTTFEEREGGPATGPRHVPKDGATLAPGTGKRPCSDGDIDVAKGVVLRGAGH